MTIKIYTSENCTPCQDIARLIKEGKTNLKEKVDLIDVETDEGFDKFSKEVLEHEDGAIPSAYKDGKRCLIAYDDEEDSLIVECPEEGPSSSD